MEARRAKRLSLVIRSAAALGATALGVLVPFSVARTEEPEPLEKGEADVAIPFIRKNCFECHEKKSKETDLVLLPLVERGSYERERALWRKVQERIQNREMPPDEAKLQPTQAERDALLAWTHRALAAADEKNRIPGDPGRVTLRRLNRAEYNYTVQDLLGVKPRPADEFPADDVGYGFDRIGDVLSLPPLLLERYFAAAESIASEAILDWKTVKLRAGADELKAKGTNSGPRDDSLVLYSNGRAEATLKVPFPGEYVLRVKAYGDQAGPDPARMNVLVNGAVAESFDVKATQGQAQVYETKVTVEAGERVFAAAFTNDYYKPDDPDPKNRDRNLAVTYVELEGPSTQPPLPWAHKTYVTKRPAAGAKSPARKAVAREVLGPLASRAFRRPAKPEELERFAKLVDLAMNEGESFERGIQLALEAILVSPSFIFRLELDTVRDPSATDVRVETLDEYALASRLSYFLWSSLPDEDLTADAAAGTLRKNLDQQVRRLIADPRSDRLVEQFAVQWLHLRRFDAFVPDPKTFPDFDEDLRAAARAETCELFRTILKENRSAQDLVLAPFTFVNERLARHYGIEGVSGKEMRKVDVPAGRGGILGHASILMATSNPTRTSPVKRGRWILDVLLDDPPPPPLPGVDSLKDESPQVAAKSVRERLANHRSKKECATCHARMDALGFALERFDASGALREMEGDQPVDDTGTLPDGHTLQGPAGLRDWLAARPAKIARSLARKLLIFGIGRGTSGADEAALDSLVESLGPDEKVDDLIVGLTKLDAFQKRSKDGVKQWK
jgi:hypothetical protein